MADQDRAAIDDPADRSDMAKRGAAAGLERHDRTNFRAKATGITPFGLAPPGMGIAIDLDARHPAGIGYALQIGRQAWVIFGVMVPSARSGSEIRAETGAVKSTAKAAASRRWREIMPW
jgi:hypothetical protein